MSTARIPMRSRLPLRLGAALLAAIAALLAAGCGGSATGRLGRVSSVRFAAVHSAHQVAQHFYAATGDSLTISPSPLTEDTLSTPSSDQQAFNRYGAFTIYVLHNSDLLSTFTTQNGQRLIPDAQDVYWSSTADSSGYWTATKVYGNVVLQWTAQSHVVNGQFRLLDAILSTLGQGARAVDAKLPPSELSCEMRGITATSRREGTCTENGVSVNVVNWRDVLHTPSYAVQGIRDELGSYISPNLTFGQPVFAKGEFFAIGLHVANTGVAPLDGLFDTELEVGGRYYSQDDDATGYLTPSTAFPLQPGEQGAVALVFDIPASAARTAVSQGELVFPEDPDSTVEDTTKLGAIRLAGAPGDAQQRAAALNMKPA